LLSFNVHEAKNNFLLAYDLDNLCLHTIERIAFCELEMLNIDKSKELFNSAMTKIKEEHNDEHPILEKI